MNINVYALGGGGINIGRHFEQFRNVTEGGFGAMNPIYIDTSRSNLTKELPEDKIFLISGVDGSGKKRDCNYREIVEAAPEILHRHKPAEMNILVHTGAGGSGSVLGPTLASLLLERGESVIILMIGSRSSQIELENTVKSLKSYETISQKRKSPVVLFYRENSTGGRSKADSEIRAVIPLISAICSGNNKELDSEDIHNFLNYSRVTRFDPTMVSLDFFEATVKLDRDQHLVSAITLTDEATSGDISGVLCPYQATGFIGENVRQSLSINLPLHACTILGAFNDVVHEMELALAEYSQSQSVVRQKSIANANEADDLGMIL